MPTYTSTFDGSEDPLSEGGTWASIASVDIPYKVGGVLSARSIGVEAWARYTVAWDNDQSSEVTLSELSAAGGAVVMTRISGNAGYWGYWINGTAFYLYRNDAGILTLIAGPAVVSFIPGHRLKLGSVGNVHTMYDNDSVMLSTTDSAYATGNPGLGLYDAAVLDDTGITAWTGVSTPPVTGPSTLYTLTGSRSYY